MRDSWMQLVRDVLRPARPHSERCELERERHLEAQRERAEKRIRAIAECERRIEAARADVFAADNGVVSGRMTALEREWRLLSRIDFDGAAMDLWAKVAPREWIDRKLWRGSERPLQIDAAVALASDVDGIARAEAAVSRLRADLGTKVVGPKIRWRLNAPDFEGTIDLLSTRLESALERLAMHGDDAAIIDRARRLERDVVDATLARFPDREVLARALGHASFVDALHRAAKQRSNPIDALRNLWRTGYVLSSVDASGVTIAIPPL